MKTQDIGYKVQSTKGMAALIEEHASEFGGMERLAILIDIAVPPTPWNCLATMLSLDILDKLSGKPVRMAGDMTETDLIDEGAEPPHGLFP